MESGRDEGRTVIRSGRTLPSRRRARVGLFVVAVFVALVTTGSTDAGDPELAKFLMNGGRDDLAKKQYDDALKKLEKAHTEDPTLIEACYWAGVALEAKKDVRSALARYREFQVGYALKKSKAISSKDEDGLAVKVQGRIDVLGAGSAEFSKIQDAYVAQLFAFAQENFIRDPGVTAKALRMLLAARPDHDGAKSLIEKLGGTAPAGAALERSKPVEGDGDSVDLIADRTLGMNNWEYGEGTLVVEQGVGQLTTPLESKGCATGKKFRIDAEVRVLGSTAHNRAFGLVFGRRGEPGYFLAIFEKTILSFIRFSSSGSTDLEKVELKKRIEEQDWHRYEVEVDGNRVRARLDGETLFDTKFEGDESASVQPGIYVQEGKFELRRLRLTRKGG